MCNNFLYFTVGLVRLYKIRKKYRCVQNIISHILLSPVVWKAKMAEDDIIFLLNRGELVEPHENEQAEVKHDSWQKQSKNLSMNKKKIKQNSYCTSANIKIFFLVQYSNDIWKNHILRILVNIVPRSVSYCTRTLVQYDILLGTIFI